MNPAFVELIGQAVNTFRYFHVISINPIIIDEKEKSSHLHTNTVFTNFENKSSFITSHSRSTVILLNKNSYFIGGIAATVLALILPC